MSIDTMRETLGAPNLSMKYEDGGKTEVYSVDGVEYRVDGGTSIHTVLAIITAARKTLGPHAERL